MNLIKPKKLEKGDTIGLLSISGEIRDRNNICKAAKYFQNLGYNTIISETTYKKFRYHAGCDEERINQLHKFFKDPDIDAIVCTRGGYGLLRMLKGIDYDLIANHPKIICGYSDITALLLMIVKKSKMVCFHGAMANGDFSSDKLSDITVKSFFNTLENTSKGIFYAKKAAIVHHRGESSGILWGGNLATIASMSGLDFIPDEKFILFIEDINEPAYKIDRMLTQLFNIECFAKNTAGIAAGQFSGIDKSKYLYEVLAEISEKYNIPCCSGFQISHDRDKLTLPVGVKCVFSSDERRIEIKENIFRDI